MNNLIEPLIKIIDRVVSSWLIYRAGKSAVIQETQEKIINDIKKRDQIESDNNNDDFEDLMRNTGSIR
jgi:hypothetical protein